MDAGRRTEGKEADMPLVTVIIVLIVVGILLWLVNKFIPMYPTIKTILNVVVVIAVLIWLLQVFGLLDMLTGFHVGPNGKITSSPSSH
jgi:hypothetical protein